MMKSRHKIWKHLCLLVLMAALTALLCCCSADDVRLPKQVDLFAGQQFALASAVEVEGDPTAGDLLRAAALADKYGVTVAFSSSDPEVVSVDAAGMLQAAAPGQATITVECAALGYSGQVQVTVQQPAAELTVPADLRLAPGETAGLNPEIRNADPAELVYTVADPSVAAVDAGGNVTALAQGRTEVTVTLPGSTLTAACRVTVGSPADSIQLSRPEAGLKPGESITLAAATAPEPVEVTWQSSDPSVAEVKNGVVTARAAGTATITAAVDGLQAACRVTVAAAAPESAASPESAAPSTGETAAPEPAASPESAAPSTGETAAPEPAASPESAAPSTGETAAPESAASPESATPSTGETAAPESAASPESAAPSTGETAAPESAASPESAAPSTGETAAPESAASPESATPSTGETATPESATPESAGSATSESSSPETARTPAPSAGAADPGGVTPEPKSWLDWLANAWASLTGG